MADVESKICVVTLIGLPGSGKTYLTNLLARHFTNLNCQFGYNVLPVTYDNYLKNIKCSDGSWKEKRKEILSFVKDKISNFKRNSKNINTKLTENPLVIIVDDNMYYKSMRYEYFKVAREYEVSFCQIYLKAKLELALMRNNQRDFTARVPEGTIRRMNELIEEPDLSNQWERFTLIISSVLKLEDTETINSVGYLIDEALKSPEKVKSVEGTVAFSQKVTETNLIHQVDITLRILVGTNIKRHKKLEGKVEDFARKLNSTRLNILENIRSGLISLPKEISEALLERNDQYKKDLVNNYLQNLLLKSI